MNEYKITMEGLEDNNGVILTHDMIDFSEYIYSLMKNKSFNASYIQSLIKTVQRFSNNESYGDFVKNTSLESLFDTFMTYIHTRGLTPESLSYRKEKVQEIREKHTRRVLIKEVLELTLIK